MASTYLLNSNPTAGNRRKGTISMWIKRSKMGSTQYFYNERYDNNHMGWIAFSGGDNLNWGDQDGGVVKWEYTTNQKFRDTNGWYHFVFAWDTTLATASERVRTYVNGEEITSFSTTTNPAQNYDSTFSVGTTTYPMVIGRLNSGTNYFDGSMAHFHRVDGQQLTPSTFGQTDSTTGIWKPKTNPSITYTGSSSFNYFLKFENSASMGTDSSGNSNNFTVNGTMTQTIDTPSNVFATYNPLNVQVATANEPKFGNGNTSILGSSSGAILWHSSSTLGVSSGKWYAEFKGGSASNQNGMVGVSFNPEEDARRNVYPGHQNHSYGYYVNGNKYNGNTAPSYGDAWTTDIIGVALDLDNHKLYFSKNGVWQNSGDPTSGATGTGAAYSLTTGKTYFFCTGDGDGTYINPFDANFGNGYFGTTAVSSAQNPDDGIGIFEYDVPAGYRALCTKSINAEEYS